MTEPVHDLGHAFYPHPVRQFRPLDHDNGQTKLARGIDLGTRACSTGIASDDPFDTPRAHHVQFAMERKGTSRHQDFRIGKRQRLMGRIDKPQSIGVLRFGAEGRDVLPPDGKEHTRGLRRQRGDSGRNVDNFSPDITGFFHPWRAHQRDQRRSVRHTGRHRVVTDLDCERMGRVDDMRDVFAADVISKPIRAAEAADTNRHRLTGRCTRAAAIGIDSVEPDTRGRIGERMSLGRSAQDKGACHA